VNKKLLLLILLYFATSIIQFSKIYIIHFTDSKPMLKIMVGLNGLEPSTSRLSGVRSKPAELWAHKMNIDCVKELNLSKLNTTHKS
jgi:hypothetical protein